MGKRSYTAQMRARNFSIKEAERQNNKCLYCYQVFGSKGKLSVRSAEHVVPLSRGGRNVNGNIIACCVRCNTRKGNDAPEFKQLVVGYIKVNYNHPRPERYTLCSDSQKNKLKPSILGHARILPTMVKLFFLTCMSALRVHRSKL